MPRRGGTHMWLGASHQSSRRATMDTGGTVQTGQQRMVHPVRWARDNTSTNSWNATNETNVRTGQHNQNKSWKRRRTRRREGGRAEGEAGKPPPPINSSPGGVLIPPSFISPVWDFFIFRAFNSPVLKIPPLRDFLKFQIL